MNKLMAVENVGPALRNVLLRITEAVEKRTEDIPNLAPRLVAVSKTKPVECILEAYKHGQRHFGENYLAYLTGIRWHFIGHLQRNKCNNLTAIPNLYMVETVDSERLATMLNSSWGKLPNREPLKVMVEVNTSAEKSKKGCQLDKCVPLAEYVYSKCPHLRLSGLMTIGEFNYDWDKHGPNPDFLRLIECRESVCEKLSLPLERFELSMGMSSDYDKAILMGSTNVRVGSTIFGSREPKQPKTSPPEASPASISQSTKQVTPSNQKPTEEKPAILNGTVDMLEENQNLITGIDNLVLS